MLAPVAVVVSVIKLVCEILHRVQVVVIRRCFRRHVTCAAAVAAVVVVVVVLIFCAEI